MTDFINLDQTFCTAIICKKFTRCERALTEEVRKEIERLSPNKPISHVEKLECYEVFKNDA